MSIESLHELAQMIARRDGISFDEAWTAIIDTQEEIQYVLTSQMSAGLMYTNAVEILQENLGIEPDYLDLFFFE